MRVFSSRKKATTVALAGALLLGTAGGAYAYWTTSGNGNGSATTGTSSALEVKVDAATGGLLTPGGPTQTVAFHITNHNSGLQRLNGVSVTVANADGTPWTAVPGCSAADYSVGTPSVATGDIASGATVDGTVTISMVNSTSNQNGCKGATVPLYVSAS